MKRESPTLTPLGNFYPTDNGQRQGFFILASQFSIDDGANHAL